RPHGMSTGHADRHDPIMQNTHPAAPFHDASSLPASTPAPTTAGADPVRTDVLIVGAGPVGLFAAFQARVLGLQCEIVDVLDRAGGQCA
ncbi:NAD(P)-binding protein, partial [Acinetobacter baumannii]